MKQKVSLPSDQILPLLLALFISCLVSIGIWVWRIWRLHDIDYWYLTPNLLLAVVPLVPAVFLEYSLRLQRTRRMHILRWVLFGLWLLFVPNSFYIVTDFIHLGENSVVTISDVVMIASFVLNGCIIGFLTLLYMHHLLEQRFGIIRARRYIAGIILLVSFGLYLGREELRLNSWDLFVQPWRLVLGIVEPLVSPELWRTAFANTMMYAIFIGSFYPVVYQLAKLARPRAVKSASPSDTL